jgi:hypothetical protein
MGHHRCLGCGFTTGRPDLHPTCKGAPTEWEVCTCGSGAHPRPCDQHPGVYEAHIDNLNAVNTLEVAIEELRALGLHDAECAELNHAANLFATTAREAGRLVWTLLGEEALGRLSPYLREIMEDPCA